MKKALKLLALAFPLFTATSVVAYPVDGGPEKGFFLVEMHSSAPLLVKTTGWHGELLTPQEFVDKQCPGAKVSDIAIAGVPTYLHESTMIQIVFPMPINGCVPK
ncbi:hypothetical protein [Pseudomonas serbica]|uniref:hypothetical protein n=1 Tax=Pseudomonas serbica TaxID=2965074 RepID=UPI00237B78EF|nr:hypothetical protein [Pseudomonas serbica]